MEPIAVRNPRSGEVDYRVMPLDREGLEAECAALRDAQPGWSLAGINARAAVLLAWADALEAHAGPICAALEVDTGRRRIAREELTRAAANIRRWCVHGPGLIDESIRPSAWVDTLELGKQYVPYPLVGVISPWNVPLALGLIDAVPALLAGCAVMVKPSEVTPRFAAPLRDSLAAVPDLARVLRIVDGGAETGRALVDLADAICFTGSVATGRKVAAAAGKRFIPAFLELGGNDPAIVMPGANLEHVADAITRSSNYATGQVCLAIERVYAHASLHDELVDLLVERCLRLQINHPDIETGELGPLIFADQARIIDEHLADAEAGGAQIRCGGYTENHGGGLYCRATVLTGVNHSMRLMREETFGPVTPVQGWDDIDEAVALANDSDYGLSGAVFAATAEQALPVARRINAGGISINDASLTRETFEVEKNAFGYSGLGGSRMGDEGLLRFFRRKALLVQRARPAALA